MRRFALLGLVLLSVAGCSVYPTIRKAGGVRIRPENARALQAAPAGGSTVVYVDVVNTGGAGDTLIGVLSDAAGRAELRSRHRRIADVSVPAASTVTLASDDRHIELYDLKRELKAGDVIIVTLLFEKSGAIGASTVVQ